MADPVVLVPQDGSPGARCALPIARRLADLLGARLEVRDQGAGETISAAAADCGATLIVMSGEAAGAGPDEAIGAAALAVLSGDDRPVVLVSPTRVRAGWDLERVLAPHDGSPAVSGALAPAIELARGAGAELVVLQVAGDARALETGAIAPPAYLDQPHHSWPAWSEEFLQRLASLSPLADVRVRLLVGHGEPAAETIRVAGAESADLIVLAWKGRWEGPHAATLKALLRDAPCPVMVTRARSRA